MNREHVVQVGFSFDEDKIIDSMCKSLEKKLADEIEAGVRKNFFKKDDYWGNSVPAMASEVMKSWLNENKDEVIQETASMLVEKLWKTKAVKDMVKAVGEEVKEYSTLQSTLTPAVWVSTNCKANEVVKEDKDDGSV